MFNDKCGLTRAALKGWKTQTRRVISVDFYNRVDWKAFEEGNMDCMIMDDPCQETNILDCGKYHVGEVVAIAQSYHDVAQYMLKANLSFYFDTKSAGWNNKMFVKANIMPHHIKITNIRVERLQDISEEDCLKEGILGMTDPMNPLANIYTFSGSKEMFYSAREAYASLIDKVSGKGVWDKNPYVFVYDFENVD